MTEHFTREDVIAALGTGLGGTASADGMEHLVKLANTLLAAKLKEWEAQGAVAIDRYVWERYDRWSHGWGWEECTSDFDPRLPEYKQYYSKEDWDDPKQIRNFRSLYTHALPAQPAEQPIKLYADSSNPDMFSRDLLDAAGNRYTIMTPSMCQFDIDASALRAAGLEMKIDGLESTPDGSSRAKMYWQPIGYSERERVVIHNIELNRKARPDLMPQAVEAIEKMGFRAGPAPDGLHGAAGTQRKE